MNIAVLTAGGVGSRLNNNIPKQFLTVNDIPIIIYTLQRFQDDKSIDKIIIACLKEWQPALLAYKKEFNIDKLEWIVEGGGTGAESIVNCLNKLSEEYSSDTTIIVHDGNRPLVSHDVIKDALEVYEKYGNAIACLPSTEVLLSVSDESPHCSGKSLNRDAIKRTQTPHVFALGEVSQLYEDSFKKGLSPVAPCDAALLNNHPVYLSKGSELNFKITTPEDLRILKALIKDGIR